MSEPVNPFANVKIAVAKKDEAAINAQTEIGQGAATPPATPIVETRSPPEKTPLTKKAVTHEVSSKTLEKIKEASIEQGYRSDSKTKRETTKTFAYTFYPSDIKAIRRIKMAVMEEHLELNISDSEVMRAAIAALNALPYTEQERLIRDQKER